MAFQLATNAKEIPRQDVLNWEKELLGLYFSKHPLSYLVEALKGRVKHHTGMLGDVLAKQKVTLGGMLTDVRRITTKKGDLMCMARLEDVHGSVHLTVFPQTYEKDPDLWAEHTVVILSGDVQIRHDEPTILCDTAERFTGLEEEVNRKHYEVWITLRLSGNDERAVSDDKMRVQALSTYLRTCPGRDHYYLCVENEEWQTHLTPSENTLAYSPEVQASLTNILCGWGEVQAKVVEQ